MKTLVYLISNRTRQSASFYLHLKLWLKRVWHFPELARLLFIRTSLRRRGVCMGILSDCPDADLVGNLRLLVIGDYTGVGRCKIMLHNTVRIGSSVVINDGVTILTASHLIDDPHFLQVSRPIFVDDYAWICTGATLLPGVRVGKGAVVAAFAVVTKDVPPLAVFAGNPAVCVKYRQPSSLSYRPNLLRACYEAWVGLPYDVSSRDQDGRGSGKEACL